MCRSQLCSIPDLKVNLKHDFQRCLGESETMKTKSSDVVFYVVAASTVELQFLLPCSDMGRHGAMFSLTTFA